MKTLLFSNYDLKKNVFNFDNIRDKSFCCIVYFVLLILCSIHVNYHPGWLNLDEMVHTAALFKILILLPI